LESISQKLLGLRYTSFGAIGKKKLLCLFANCPGGSITARMEFYIFWRKHQNAGDASLHNDKLEGDSPEQFSI